MKVNISKRDISKGRIEILYKGRCELAQSAYGYESTDLPRMLVACS